MECAEKEVDKSSVLCLRSPSKITRRLMKARSVAEADRVVGRDMAISAEAAGRRGGC